MEPAWENLRGETLRLDCRMAPRIGPDGKVALVPGGGHGIMARRAAEMEHQAANWPGQASCCRCWCWRALLEHGNRPAAYCFE